MKKIILITIFSMLLLPVKAQWYRKYEATNDRILSRLTVINKDTLFIFENIYPNAQTYYLKRTFNGGNTWQNFSFPEKIEQLQFVNNIGYMVKGNYVIKTTDFGSTWQNVFSFAQTGLSAPLIYVMNENTFIKVVRDNNGDNIFISFDEGQTWQQMNFTDLDYIYRVNFINNQTGYISWRNNNYQVILSKTTDSGQTWTIVNNDLPTDMFSPKMIFLNENIGFLDSYNGLKKTTDGGVTWTDTNLVNGSDFAIINDQLAWSVMCAPPACTGCHIASYIYKYNGETITEFEYVTPDVDDYDYCYSQISFPEATTGYVLSDYFLFKNDTGINTGFISKTENLTYEQFKIYPNPNKGIFNIKFDKNQSQNWQYQITNLQGQILINNQQLIDNKIDASRLPAGVYLLNLQNDEKIYTQKIIIQK